MRMSHGQMDLSSFAAAALTSAYKEGGPWLAELLETFPVIWTTQFDELDNSDSWFKNSKASWYISSLD